MNKEKRLYDLELKLTRATQENNELKWALMDAYGTIEKSGYNVTHFCPALCKIIDKIQNSLEKDKE